MTGPKTRHVKDEPAKAHRQMTKDNPEDAGRPATLHDNITSSERESSPEAGAFSGTHSSPEGYAGARSMKSAIGRGIRNKCPRCGRASILHRYLKVHDHCSVCRQNFSGHRADDAPAYFTMLIAGHLVIPIALEIRRVFDPPLGLQFLICTLALGILVYFLLPMTKGALIGIQWAKRMHGFADDSDVTSDH